MNLRLIRPKDLKRNIKQELNVCELGLYQMRGIVLKLWELVDKIQKIAHIVIKPRTRDAGRS
jgi:hypothetical protein